MGVVGAGGICGAGGALFGSGGVGGTSISARTIPRRPCGGRLSSWFMWPLSIHRILSLAVTLHHNERRLSCNSPATYSALRWLQCCLCPNHKRAFPGRKVTGGVKIQTHRGGEGRSRLVAAPRSWHHRPALGSISRRLSASGNVHDQQSRQPERCPFIALSRQQTVANNSKGSEVSLIFLAWPY